VALGVLGGELMVHVLDAGSLVAPRFTEWTVARAVLVAVAMGALGSLYPAW
jgi:hypothetical protein